MTDTDRGQVQAAAARVYEEFFVPALFGQWPQRVLDAVGVEPGHRVLDVGCGTGIVARAATARVGDDGVVVGLDPNEGMVAVARGRPEPVEWRTGVAEDLPFPDASFDRVVTQFAMMFYTDRDAAVSEMRRVLTDGGVAAVATWSSLDLTPGYDAMVGLLDDLFGADAANALRAPFVLGDREELADLLGSAFPDVTVTLHDGVARFASVDAWVHTDIRGWTLTDMIDDDQFELLRRRANTELARFTGPDGTVSFPAPALVAVARP